jgi:hypothetical protein
MKNRYLGIEQKKTYRKYKLDIFGNVNEQLNELQKEAKIITNKYKTNE